jgi:hypothetical protein
MGTLVFNPSPDCDMWRYWIKKASLPQALLVICLAWALASFLAMVFTKLSPLIIREPALKKTHPYRRSVASMSFSQWNAADISGPSRGVDGNTGYCLRVGGLDRGVQQINVALELAHYSGDITTALHSIGKSIGKLSGDRHLEPPAIYQPLRTALVRCLWLARWAHQNHQYLYHGEEQLEASGLLLPFANSSIRSPSMR